MSSLPVTSDNLLSLRRRILKPFSLMTTTYVDLRYFAAAEGGATGHVRRMYSIHHPYMFKIHHSESTAVSWFYRSSKCCTCERRRTRTRKTRTQTCVLSYFLNAYFCCFGKEDGTFFFSSRTDDGARAKRFFIFIFLDGCDGGSEK